MKTTTIMARQGLATPWLTSTDIEENSQFGQRANGIWCQSMQLLEVSCDKMPSCI